jgi:hypothetical protein
MGNAQSWENAFDPNKNGVANAFDPNKNGAKNFFENDVADFFWNKNPFVGAIGAATGLPLGPAAGSTPQPTAPQGASQEQQLLVLVGGAVLLYLLLD